MLCPTAGKVLKYVSFVTEGNELLSRPRFEQPLNRPMRIPDCLNCCVLHKMCWQLASNQV